MRKKIKILLIIIINLFILSGCWDAREINELGMVTAVAIDKADSPNKYSITVQIANQNSDNSNSSEGGGGGKNSLWIETGEGTSIFDAVRNLVNVSSRRIMWAHNSVVIIGESLAREGITPVVDYFTHSPELRMKTAVVVSNGNAKQYIESKIGMESPPGIAFVLIENYRTLTAESIESDMLEIGSALKSKYTNPLISKVSLKESAMKSQDGKSQDGGAGDGNSSSESQEGGSSKILELSGGAIFKRDKMMGWLSPKEMRGIAWILNQTKNTAVTVSDPEHENKSVTVETEGIKAKIKSKVTKGMPEIFINISGKGHIVEEDGVTSQNKNIEEIKENLNRLVEKEIAKEIKDSLEVVQKDYMIDCLNFALIVHSQNPKQWRNGLKDRWEEVFPQIPVTISANIDITSSVLNQEPRKLY